jgi:cobalt/nickel transport system permease protein
VINTIAQIDLLASSGRTPWHRASALAKLLLAALLIGLAVAAPSLALLAALHVLAWGLAVGGRLPLPLILAAAGYPIPFAVVFALAHWDGRIEAALPLLLRPLTASLTAVWLVGTTPYPDLFAPLSRLLPRGAGDGLFLTYRALSELIGRTERMWRALRLRGGTRGSAARRLGQVGEGLGTLVLYGFERSQRVYAVMSLRGHSGRICGCRHWAARTREDALAAAVAVVASLLAVALWRMP